MELKRGIKVLWKWKWLFLLVLIAAVGSTIFFTFTQVPIYETSVRLVVSPSSSLAEDLNDLRSAVTALSAPVVANTYAEIAQTPAIIEKAWGQLNIKPKINYTVVSTVIQETIIVNITVSGPDPKLSQSLANAITDQTIKYVEGLTTVYSLTPLNPAVAPLLPAKPNYQFNLVMGIVLGLIAGVLLAFMAEYLTAPSLGAPSVDYTTQVSSTNI